MTEIRLGPGVEFDRVRDIVDALGAAAGGIGDDTGIVPAGEGTLLVSTDLSIEHQHFERAWLTTDEIGWRAAASALSDLAAGGATPVGMVVGVGIPRDAVHTDVVEIMRGVGSCARSCEAIVIGGDISVAPAWMMSVTVFGYAQRPMSRRGARPGDGLWVTGVLGGARAALIDWQRGSIPSAAARKAFAHPEARLQVGEWLAGHQAHAMMDLSDGLGGDALHLAAASACRLRIDLGRVPMHGGVTDAANLTGEFPQVFAAVGGEDYELLVAMPGAWDDANNVEALTGVSMQRIGSVVEGSGVEFSLNGRVMDVKGYRHAV